MITELGELSIGEAVPGAAAAAGAGVAGINAALPDITARLDALQSFVPLPVDFTAQLALAQQIIGSINLSISAGLPTPPIGAQVAVVLELIAALMTQIGTIQAHATIIAGFQAQLIAAGVVAYAYDGAAASLGGELAAELAAGLPGHGPFDHCNALVLATTNPTTWSAMGAVFKVAP